MTDPANALLLSSGGLDSAVLAATTGATYHLSVNYGQEHKRELASARQIAAHYGAAHEERACRLPAKVGDVVPNRNSVLISIGAAVAEARGFDVVLIGCNAEDAAGFPDCRPAFIDIMREAVELATEDRVTLHAPLLGLTKPEIGKLAIDLRVPTHLAWSCYRGGPLPCGICHACQGRAAAGV